MSNELICQIIKINQYAYMDKPAIFEAITANGNIVKCINSFYSPIDISDKIIGKVSLQNDGYLNFIQRPYITIDIQTESIKSFMLRNLRVTGIYNIDDKYDKIRTLAKYCQKIDNKIKENRGEPILKTQEYEDINSYLTDLACKYHSNLNSSVYLGLIQSDFTEDQAKILLNRWYKKRCVRKITLFGISDKELEESYKSLDDLYNCIIKNPYMIGFIPIKKADEISKSLDLENPFNRSCGIIVREIFSKMKSGWTCVPISYMHKRFKNFYKYKNALIEDYEIKIVTFNNIEYVYFNYAYEIEQYVANYLNDLIIKNAINYIPPNIDNFIEYDPKKIILNNSYMYTCKTLTDEQKIAICGALNNKICIITGAGGTGKCLHPDTKILMADGSITKCSDIKIEDLIMGYDSKPRIVKSICSGIDDMYKIEYNGRFFICNKEHLLTVIYIPSIKKIKEGYKIGNKCFASKHLCESYLKNVNSKMFEIAVKDYIKYNDRKYLRLATAMVNYPNKITKLEPYIYGYCYNNFYGYININNDNIYNYISNFIKLEKCNGTEYFVDNIKENDTDYIINSYDIRLKVLAGIIDNNRTIIEPNRLIILTHNDKLADFVRRISLSMGFNYCLMKNNNEYSLIIRTDKLKYIPSIMWKFELDKNTCHSDSLYDIINKPDLYDFSMKFTCTFESNSIYNGFELAALDKNEYEGRFLLEDCTITHNTSIIKEIVNNLTYKKLKVVGTAFMGIAVDRLSEVMGDIGIIGTMDRLVKIAHSISKFDKLILEECSMIATPLFWLLITALPFEFDLIFVGDINQIQPIKWGMLMNALKTSRRIPMFVLTRNFRIEKSIADTIKAKAEGIELSRNDENNDHVILNNANYLIDEMRIKYSLDIPMVFQESNGFSVYEDCGVEVIKVILEALKNASVQEKDIVIMCPYNSELYELNFIAQDIFRKDNEYEIVKNKRLMIGDRMMCLSNNSKYKIYNGSDGILEEITKEGCLISFKDGVKILFKWDNDIVDTNDDYEDRNLYMKDVTHCFATTIDKMQGKDKAFCIIYLPKRILTNGEQSEFVTIQRFYTAITRAKKAVFIVGDKNAINLATKTLPKIKYENLANILMSMRVPELEDKLNKYTNPEYVSAIINIEEEEEEDFFDFD